MNVELTKSLFKAGTKVRLNYMLGEPHMPTGLLGTVQFVDDIGQIHVNWDNGSTLALSPDDDFTVITYDEMKFKR